LFVGVLSTTSVALQLSPHEVSHAVVKVGTLQIAAPHDGYHCRGLQKRLQSKQHPAG
jgi:hypothetical protein